ncbi:tRNA lysidine(34) synthetase TilS [Sphingomonas sp. Leaf343]|uniref:tRNA lysidine(34) synthetase TilS n=1 Tax=Sphingomonas sp. Leaf343 TaxID=1736345 RepID=UPI000AD3BC57|nr:tRNA lysidine(34) synthetase TilS [Sphingomonas sp. Leaf343]
MAVPPPSVGEARTIDAAQVDRFRTDVGALLADPPGIDRPLALAVSGGPDSMAMLALATAGFPGRVIAATVDHRLRPDAADEAAMVAGWCADAEIPHRTLTLEPLPGGNLHAEARAARYAILADWATGQGAQHLATAHHADDQAETFLMRANRGSGLAGLAGIRPQRAYRNLTIVRPLLGWRRATLRAVAEAAALPFVDDPANDADRFDRTHLRRHLAGQNLLDPAALARSAGWCAEADADLRAMRDWLWSGRARSGDELAIDVADLPRALCRLLVRRAIEGVRTALAITHPTFSESTNVEALLDALQAGRSATQAGVMASPRGTTWYFREAPPRRSL